MESKRRHTTRAAAHQPARVCGPRNGNRSSSILVVAFEDRYILQSVVAIGGPLFRAIRPCFTFRQLEDARSRALFRTACLPEMYIFFELKWISNANFDYHRV